MENKRFEHIITRYLKGKATPEEEAELLQAIHASKEWEAAFRKRTAEWNPLEETEADPETDRSALRTDYQRRVRHLLSHLGMD